MGRIYDLFMSKYNYTDFHELNLDWLIVAVEQFEYEMDNFVSINAVKYADPIQWNITKQYEKNTIVIDPVTGTAYISAKPVPAGVALSRTDYWNVVFDLGRFITLAAQNFANTYEELPTTTATTSTNEGDWVVWDSTLYIAKNDIHVGDMYVPDGNIEKKTVEDFFNMLASALDQEIQDRQDADIQIMLDVNDLIASEARIRSDEDIRIYQELSDLISSDIGLIQNEIGNINDLNTDDKSSIVNAVNEVKSDIDTTDARVNDIEDDITAIAAPVSPYYYPENYGGKVDDNSVDNSDAIKSAILAANVTGGTVILQNGIYYCQSPITITEHLYNVTILGAGGSYLSSESGILADRGTSINYTGNGDFIHFSNGTWKCDFKNFDIYSEGNGAAIKFSNDDDPLHVARATNNLMDNVVICFGGIGIEIDNAAYFTLRRVTVRHHSRNDDSLNTDTNPTAFKFANDNEYISLYDCVGIPNQINAFNSTSWSIGLDVSDCRHLVSINLDITDCDCGVRLHPESGNTVGFINLIATDVARAHYGLYTSTNLNPIGNITVNQFTFTSESTLNANNRILRFRKTAGIAAYSVRGSFENVTARTGEAQMDYWMEADDDAIGVGLFNVNFISNNLPKTKYNNNIATSINFSTQTSQSAQNIDWNSIKSAGVYPAICGSGSTNGPGYAAMMVNFTTSISVFQLALPTTASASNPVKYRYYNAINDTWGSWLAFTAT